MTTDIDATSACHLGRPELDPEHQGQIDLLHAVEAELRGARDPAQLARLLDGLVEYTSIHFMSEQLIMGQHVYPGLPAHEAEHDQLMEQMRAFQKRIGSGDRTLAADDLSALREWVLCHIRTKDTAFAEFLTDNV